MPRSTPCSIASTIGLLLLVACPEPAGTVLPAPEDTAPETSSLPVTPKPTLKAELEVLRQPSCANPERRTQQPYTLQPALPDEAVFPNSNSLFVGGGLTLADLNADGVLDLFLTARSTDARLFLGLPDGNGFQFEAATDRLPPLPERTSGASAVDVDLDGDLDLVVSVFRDFDRVLLNDGDAQFSSAPNALGMDGPFLRRSISSSWADIDQDGVLEGFFASYGALSQTRGGLPEGDPSALYKRQPDGTWTDIGAWTAPDPMATSHAFQGAFTDVDNDGWLDLFVVNDFGWTTPTVLLPNEQGVMGDADTRSVSLKYENMGLGLGDFNHDGTQDFVVAAWDRMSLLMSEQDGWFDVATARDLRTDPTTDRHVPWGTQVGDLDNDGDLDIFVGYGHLDVTSNGINPLAQPDAVYLQNTKGQFIQLAETLGLDHPGWTRGALLVDIDRDGWLDVLVRDLRGPTRMYKAQCGYGSFLGFELRQPGHNPTAIGARIRVHVNGVTYTEELRLGGTGYASSGPVEAHFGLGEATAAEWVEVRWPDGEVSVAEDVPVNRWWRWTREPS